MSFQDKIANKTNPNTVNLIFQHKEELVDWLENKKLELETNISVAQSKPVEFEEKDLLVITYHLELVGGEYSKDEITALQTIIPASICRASGIAIEIRTTTAPASENIEQTLLKNKEIIVSQDRIVNGISPKSRYYQIHQAALVNHIDIWDQRALALLDVIELILSLQSTYKNVKYAISDYQKSIIEMQNAIEEIKSNPLISDEHKKKVERIFNVFVSSTPAYDDSQDLEHQNDIFIEESGFVTMTLNRLVVQTSLKNRVLVLFKEAKLHLLEYFK